MESEEGVRVLVTIQKEKRKCAGTAGIVRTRGSTQKKNGEGISGDDKLTKFNLTRRSHSKRRTRSTEKRSHKNQWGGTAWTKGPNIERNQKG